MHQSHVGFDHFENFLAGALPGAEKIFMEGFTGSPGKELKPDFSLVSEYDRRIESFIQNLLRENFPNDAIEGEEWDSIEGISNGRWFIDPIDGTRSYLSGNPLCGILVGYCYDTNPIFGAASIPALKRRYFGDGEIAKLNGIKIRTSSKIKLEEAVMACTNPDQFSADIYPRFRSLAKNCLALNWGGDCFNYMALAEGKVDLVYEVGLKSVDIFPLIPILTGAGAMVTDNLGNPIRADKHWNGTIISAANLDLHQQALKILNN